MHGEVAFEHRDFMHGGDYPPMGDHHIPSPEPNTFADAHDAVVNELTDGVNYNDPGVPSFDGADDHLDLDNAPPQTSMRATPPSNDRHLLRNKAIPKPYRKITKNDSGKFICTHPACEDDIREFKRKCEWRYVYQSRIRSSRCTNPYLLCQQTHGQA